jgi:serpin B
MHRRQFLLTLPALAAGAGLSLWAALPPAAPGPEAKAVSSANTAFALDLYAKLRDQPGNLFCSPYSISAALAMTSAGARGETLAEMNKVLHLPADGSAHAGFAALRSALNADLGKGVELTVANALWGQQGFPFRKEFLALTKKDYGAGLRTVDFAHPEQARQTINRWVEEQTKDRIKDLLPAGSLDASARLVLTNAIYFKGTWAKQFPKAATRDEPFRLGGGRTAPVPLMRVGGSFPYFADDAVQAVSLQYAGGHLSLVVLLPKAADGLADLERSLTAEKLNGWLAGLRRKEGDVLLPRYKVTSAFDLGATLQGMGMKLAFGPAADFSGMTPSGEQLLISKVVHKAFVDVNEEGSEAAAATGVAVTLAAAPVPSERFTFRADHPFVFLIRDDRTGSVLFLGRYAGPAG